MENYKIAIDLMGSDNGPLELCSGVATALSDNPELSLVLFGDEAQIRPKLFELGCDMNRVEIVHSSEVIDNYDNPMEAIFRKTDSSLVKALIALAEREDILGLINASSTGALLAGSLRYVPAAELKRPALASILPAERGGYICLLDTGANIDCSPSQLVDFAHMGSDFMRASYNIENPRVGLLSNGTESTKGNKLVKATHLLLKEEEGINFVGNIEGTNALTGDCDVLVCDGFAGNQVFKNSEGIARRLITDIVRYAKKTGSDEIMKLVGHLMATYDFSALGGAIVLGAGKPIIKARGSATAPTVANTSAMMLNIVKNRDLFHGKDKR